MIGLMLCGYRNKTEELTIYVHIARIVHTLKLALFINVSKTNHWAQFALGQLALLWEQSLPSEWLHSYMFVCVAGGSLLAGCGLASHLCQLMRFEGNS